LTIQIFVYNSTDRYFYATLINARGLLLCGTPFGLTGKFRIDKKEEKIAGKQEAK